MVIYVFADHPYTILHSRLSRAHGKRKWEEGMGRENRKKEGGVPLAMLPIRQPGIIIALDDSVSLIVYRDKVFSDGGVSVDVARGGRQDQYGDGRERAYLTVPLRRGERHQSSTTEEC